ncbi:MAG: membrane integrity-associated transporter subunit PqiC [Opitutales bacterium]
MIKPGLGLLFCIYAVACVNLEPRSGGVREFVLGPAAWEQAAKSGPGFYVDRPELPAYLSGNRFLYRGPGGEIREIPNALWVEPLREGVARALAGYIAMKGESGLGGFYPWSKTDKEIPELRLRIQHFAPMANGKLRFAASWELRKSGETVESGEVKLDELEWKPGNPRDFVAGMNHGLEAVADEVADAL